MKKILIFTNKKFGEEEIENINELNKRFQVSASASLTLLKKLLKGDFDACIIEADTFSLSPRSKELWLKFYEKTFQRLGKKMLIFWSWSDEFREEIESIGSNVFFVRKDGDKDHLLLAATDLLEE